MSLCLIWCVVPEASNFAGSNEADVKFLRGYDHNRRMGFIVFDDLFAADWDYSDTLHVMYTTQKTRSGKTGLSAKITDGAFNCNEIKE